MSQPICSKTTGRWIEHRRRPYDPAMDRLSPALVAIVLLPLAACTRSDNGHAAKEPETSSATASASSAGSAPTTAAPVPEKGEIDARFVADLQKAFAEYKAWGRVDDELRWAPFLCRMPMPGTARMSAADEGEHARKLYSLFARDRAAYVSMNGEAPTIARGGQVVVKESYLPELVPDAGPAEDPRVPVGGISGNAGNVDADHFKPYARADDGRIYRASKLAGLYVVLEKPKGTPGTDEGFVYGTLTPAGEITSAGKIASCMGCHLQAKHRRFFGTSGRN
ncbi:MAG: hypothetical protein BGO98_41820 [Myxococcales bacterium 68-20]|nr:MAG: hypothetical protein BGO98_41820 [Myxococcales bacterium 68-20]